MPLVEQRLFFYQQHKSCCLCLGDTCVLLTYQNPNTVQLEPNCGGVFNSIIIVATRNKILTVYLWPLCLPRCTSAKCQQSGTGFELWPHNSVCGKITHIYTVESLEMGKTLNSLAEIFRRSQNQPFRMTQGRTIRAVSGFTGVQDENCFDWCSIWKHFNFKQMVTRRVNQRLFRAQIRAAVQLIPSCCVSTLPVVWSGTRRSQGVSPLPS